MAYSYLIEPAFAGVLYRQIKHSFLGGDPMLVLLKQFDYKVRLGEDTCCSTRNKTHRVPAEVARDIIWSSELRKL